MTKTETMRGRLSKYIAQKSYIEIERTGDFPYGCIPVCMSDQLLMTLRFQDFEPEGYEVVPLEVIKKIKRSNTESYFGRIVKREGAQARLEAAPDIDLQNWTSVFGFLQKTGENVIVDIGKEGCCNVGRVTRVLKEKLQMRCFSPTGVWDDEDWTEPYENITSIQLRTHYVEMFAKYMPPLKMGE